MEETRGSDELFRRLQQPNQLSVEELRHLVSSVEDVAGHIEGWEIYGKPAIEALRASFTVDRENLSGLIEKVLAVRPAFHLIVHPIGVPQIERYRMTVETGLVAR